MPRQKRGLFVLLLVLIGVFFIPSRVRADASCTASFSDRSMYVGQSKRLTIQIANQGSDPLVVWYLYLSGSGATVTGGSGTGWTGTVASESQLQFSDGSIAPGQSQDFSIDMSALADPADLTLSISATNQADSNGLVDCGSSPLSVIATTAPVISELTISDVSDSSAKVSWTTDHSATSSLEYGTTSAYGASKTDSSMVTSHAVTLTGLSANTTYHAKLSGTDGDGFTGSTTDFTFATAAQGQTSTETVTVSTTTTQTVTVHAPAATPIPDTTAPKIVIETKIAAVYTEAPEVIGSVTDTGGVDVIEYSTDAGENWLPVDPTWKNAAKKVSFSFTPEGLVDGNYPVLIRAKDVSGNQRKTKPETLVIDRLPPSIGGVLLSTGTFVLDARQDGTFEFPLGLHPMLTFAAVGGPTTISVQIAGKEISAVKNLVTRLWTIPLQFDHVGRYELRTRAVDGANNVVVGSLPTIDVIPNGVIHESGSPVPFSVMTAFTYDPIVGMYSIWNGSQYGQVNPQKSDELGQYQYILPVGRYYLEATTPAGQMMRTRIFSVDGPQIIASDFAVRSRPRFHIGRFSFWMPDFGTQDVAVALLSHEGPIPATQSALINAPLPDFELQGVHALDFRGKATILTILTSWVPQVSAQLQVLEDIHRDTRIQTTAVFSQESETTAQILAKRGGYQVSILADPDGILTAPLNLTQLPTHLVIDRKGVVKAVAYGFRTREQLELLLAKNQ